MRTRTGYLFQKRPSGNYYVRTVIKTGPGPKDRQVIVKTTGTANLRQAKKRQVEIMRPFVLGQEATILRAVADRIKDANAEEKTITATPAPGISEAWSAFDASPHRSTPGESTLRQYKAEWDRFAQWLAAQHPKALRVDQVSSKIATEYAKHLASNALSDSTYNQHLNLLQMVWTVLNAERDEDDPELPNPWTGPIRRKVTPQTNRANRKRDLTKAQYDAVIAAATSDPEVQDLFIILAWTGLRLADAVLMKWGACDFAERVITLVPQKTALRNGEEVNIVMFPEAVKVLDKRQDGQVMDAAGYVFPELAAEYQRDRNDLQDRIRAAFTKAKLTLHEQRPGRKRNVVLYGAHSFRHLFVTACVAAGVPPPAIKMMTGHTTDRMTAHYTHLGKQYAAEIATRIGNGDLKKLPTPADPATTLAQVREILSGMTAESWEADRDRALALGSG